MKTRLLLMLILSCCFLGFSQAKKAKNDFKDIFDLDAIKSDQDFFSQAIIQFQLLEKIIQKYGYVYHLYPKDNPGLSIKKQLTTKTVKEEQQFDLDNGVPTMVLFGNTWTDGNSRNNQINEKLYSLGVDRCQYQIPMSLDELDGGFQFSHYMFKSSNKAALNAFGIVKNNYDSDALYIVIDYIQYKDNQCPGVPKIRYGVGIRSEIRITNWDNKLDIKESSLASLAANAEITNLKVNITVKTIGITGLDSKLNIPSNTSFDVDTFADYQKIIDFIRQFDDKEKVKNKADELVADVPTDTPTIREIKDLKKVVLEKSKEANSYDNIIFKPQLIPVMDEYRTSISQSFIPYYENLTNLQQKLKELMKEKKKYEEYKKKSTDSDIDKAMSDIYKAKIDAVLEEIKDVKDRKDNLKNANIFSYDLGRYTDLLRVINNYTPSTDVTTTATQTDKTKNDIAKTDKINTEIYAINNAEWIIIIGADNTIDAAKTELTKALNINKNSNIIKREGVYRTVMMGYKSKDEALNELNRAKAINDGAYIRNKQEWCKNGVTEDTVEGCLICN